MSLQIYIKSLSAGSNGVFNILRYNGTNRKDGVLFECPPMRYHNYSFFAVPADYEPGPDRLT
mgnify:CR=1